MLCHAYPLYVYACLPESLFGGGGKGGWVADLHVGGQEEGIGMKGAQSKVKWRGGGHHVNGWPCPPGPPPPIVAPLVLTTRYQ